MKPLPTQKAFPKISLFLLPLLMILAIIYGLLVLKYQDVEFFMLEITYIDPNVNETISLDDSPKKNKYCLSLNEAHSKMQQFVQHPDYHVFQPNQMTISQKIFHSC